MCKVCEVRRYELEGWMVGSNRVRRGLEGRSQAKIYIQQSNLLVVVKSNVV